MSEPLPDPFEFLKKLWNPMGMPMPGMIAPTLDVDAIEKKIADLKSVENWLNLNLSMLRLSIQGLEMQRNTLAAMKAMQTGSTAEGTGQSANNPLADPTAWWSMMQAAAAAASPPEAKPAHTEPTKAKPR